MPQTRKIKVYRCQNCDSVFKRESQIKLDIKDFSQRVAPGEVCPAGECKKCGALVHVEEATEQAKEFQFSVEGTVIREGFSKKEVLEKLNQDLEEVFADFDVR